MTSEEPVVSDRGALVYSVLLASFVVMLVLTNIIGVKLFLAFPETLPNGLFGEAITLTTGLITYPITFLLTDVVCEVYGARKANLMVVTGFILSLLTLALIQIAILLPGSPAWHLGSPEYASIADMQTAFESVFTLPGVLILGSMTAYLTAQLLDIRLFHFWRRVTQGRHLWLRNNASTMLSQLVDTIIVNSIFLGFGLGLGWPLVAKVIVASYIFKLLIAALDTPFVYLGVAFVRRYVKSPSSEPSPAG